MIPTPEVSALDTAYAGRGQSSVLGRPERRGVQGGLEPIADQLALVLSPTLTFAASRRGSLGHDGRVQFEEFLHRVERTIRASWKPGRKYPYKDVLLAAVLVRIAAGKQLSNEVVLDGALRALYRRIQTSLFPLDTSLKDDPGQPFRHLEGNSRCPAIWKLEAEGVTDARLRAMVRGGENFKTVMPHVRCAVLDADVFATLAASPAARTRFAELLVAKLHAAGAQETQLRALNGSMVLADAGNVLTSDVEDQTGPQDREDRLRESAIEDYIVEHWGETPFAAAGVDLHDRQYAIPTGVVDLVGWQRKRKAWWIIELKRGKAEDRVVGQLLRYSGWFRKEALRPKESLRGVILAREASNKLRYAVGEIPHAEVWTFDDDLNIRPAA